MNIRPTICFRILIFSSLLAGGAAMVLAAPAHHAAAGVAAPTGSHPAQALPAALRPVFYQALAKDAGAAYAINKHGCAVLAEQGLKACFDNHGAHFSGSAPLSLHLVAWGRGCNLADIASVRPAIKANRVSYSHGSLTEWWRVLPVGFEQGFTIAKRPAGHRELTLALAMSRQDAGAPSPRHSRAGGNPVEEASRPAAGIQGHSGFRVPFRSPGMTKNGRDTNSHWIPASAGMTKKEGGTLAWGKLRYGQLVVTDANGKVVPATLQSEGGHILIAVNDAQAAYPLTVDPIIWLDDKITADDGTADDEFGFSVALDGSTAIVGAPYADVTGNNSQGVAYVFSESNGTWTQTAKLTASDGAEGDSFGFSVALDGATVFVGAPFATVDGSLDQGAVYVFSESGGSWTQAAKLNANDGTPFDEFGYSVALDGATTLIGALCANFDPESDECGPGAAYVFSNAGLGWTQTAKLIASDGAPFDDFGDSVALDETTALVGAACATYNPETQFCGPGAAYVFDESGGTWTQTIKLTASDGAPGDAFGFSVALYGGMAFIGTPFASYAGGIGEGAVYVFAEVFGAWGQGQKLSPSDAVADGSFGYSVALNGSTALIGATDADGAYGNPDTGAAYVFTYLYGSWSEARKLTAGNGALGDSFGRSVALDDRPAPANSSALIGAPRADVNGNETQGATYFDEQWDFTLIAQVPDYVDFQLPYLAQAFATNNGDTTSAPVIMTLTIPEMTDLVSISSTQGQCSEIPGTTIESCELGPIGSGGSATVNMTLQPRDAGLIENTATITNAVPPLTVAAATIALARGTCPEDYTAYTGTLEPGRREISAPYEAPAGEEDAILMAPPGFRMFVAIHHPAYKWTIYRIPGTEVHRRGPAGTYRWIVKASDIGGAYTLCVMHP